MTELQILLNFLLSISNRYDVKLDIERLVKLLNYVYLQKDTRAFANFLAALLALDDAIVTGLNTGKFVWTDHSVFSHYPQSRLPKFLRGVLSKVFDDDGNLREHFDINDVAILEGLRLVRRAQFHSMKKEADKKAEDKFISYQREPRVTDPEIVAQLKQAWGYFAPESLFDQQIQLGFPGNGVTKDMQFPYVPKLSFPDIRTCPHEHVTKKLTTALAMKLTGPCFDAGYPDSNLVRVYPFHDDSNRIANLAVVPKTCLIGRAITVTDTFSTIVGATMRETLFNVANSWYLTKVFNVHDQTLSHKTLHSDFDTTSYIDLEGGSSCLTVELLDTCLPSYLSALHKACRPSHFKDSEGTIHEMRTLTMGDSSSVALLTCTLGLVMINAVYEHYQRKMLHEPRLPFTRDRWLHALEFVVTDGRFHVVGDDMVFPSEFEPDIRRILVGIGVTINERKSSSRDSRHKETCGAWVVKDPHGKHHSIFPYRCPDKTQSSGIRQMATQSFILRSLKSINATDLALAVTTGLPFDDLMKYESYDLLSVGSPFGSTEPVCVYRTFQPDPSDLPDELSYAFGIEPGKCFARFSRKPMVQPIGYKRRVSAPQPVFLSYSKAIKAACRHSRARRPNPPTRPRPLTEWLLAFLHVNRLVTLFA